MQYSCKSSSRSTCSKRSPGIANSFKIWSFVEMTILSVLLLVLVGDLSLVEATYSNISEYSGDSGWIRLCSSGGGDNILGVVPADKCSSGYWFKDPIRVGCACGHGVWIFAKSWCDRTARVIVAYNGSCFAVDKDVKYIRSIGNPTKAYMPYHFQTTSGFEYVQELPANFEYTYYSPTYDQHLGAIFPINQVESQNSRRCLEYNSTKKSAVAMKYYADKLPYRQTSHCYKPHGQKNPFVYDDVFPINQFFAMREKTKDPLKPFGAAQSWNGKDDARCSMQCIGNGVDHGNETKAERGSTVPPDYLDPLKDDYLIIEPPVSGSGGNSTDANSTNATAGGGGPKMRLEFPLFSRKSLHDCDNAAPKYNLTTKTVREINEQTKRMILANLAYSLKGIATPKVEVADFVLFQISRKILHKVCPTEEVPHNLLTGLLRMFRVAVKESLRFYPFEEKEDENKTLAILDGLRNCLNSSKPFSFNYDNATSPDATCPTEFQGVTHEYTGVKPLNRTLLTDLPMELKTDLQQLDLPVETAWKTVLLTHYYCSRHFTFNVSDYSYFYDKMEMFFNRWIQHRWYYPGPSFKAYEYVFQMYDLKKFSENLDKCVGASRSFSNYRKWLKRPVYVKHCGGTSFQTVDDRNPTSGRKPKLDFVAPELTEFRKKAYCLPYWHSPASNPGINYDPSRDGSDGCVQYKGYEWEDDMTPNILVNWNNQIQ